MSPILGVTSYALIPFAGAVAGALWAAWRPPSARARSAVQHAAAGILFAAVALELLAEERTHARVPVIIGFALGLVTMLTLRAWSEPRRESGVGLIATTGVDLFIDGLVLGAGFTAATQTGILLTIALTFEVVFLGVSVAATIAEMRETRTAVVGKTSAVSALLVAGATAGVAIFPRLSATAFTMVLGFATVSLLYLVTEELLVEAHEVPETPLTAAMFYAGFLLFLIIEMTAAKIPAPAP